MEGEGDAEPDTDHRGGGEAGIEAGGGEGASGEGEEANLAAPKVAMGCLPVRALAAASMERGWAMPGVEDAGGTSPSILLSTSLCALIP